MAGHPTGAGKRRLTLTVADRTRVQTGALDLHYLFAPLKHARLDYVAQKAVEMGASRLQPIITRHAQVARVNLERLRANAIEAAEQCGILTLPDIGAPLTFERMLADRDPSRLFVFCDEDAEVKDPIAALAAARDDGRAEPRPLAVLVGPEGGFAARSAPRCSRCRTRCASRSVRAFYAPIPPRSPRSLWWEQCLAIGGKSPRAGQSCHVAPQLAHLR